MPASPKILFINRKPCGYVSIERVFEQVAASLEKLGMSTGTVTLPFDSTALGVFLNLLLFRPPKAAIYHVTGHTHFICLRLPRARTVLTIHDLRFLDHPNALKRWFIRKLFLDWPVRKAAVVTAVSDFTREEIIRQTGCSPEKVVTVANPIRTEFLSGSCGRRTMKGKLVLHVGTMANKNLRNLILALRGTDLSLHVVGELDEGQRQQLEESGVSYVNSPNLDADGILSAYRGADVLSFCSTFEGFGLPIIEAQAVGLPVVTSDVSPLREVAGDGAILVDPSDPSAIRDGIVSVLEDQELATRTAHVGLENVKRFLPDAIANAYAAVYGPIEQGERTQ